jgi:leucine-rich repeat-containing protein 49
MNNLPNIQINQDVKSFQKSKSSKKVLVSSGTNTLTSFSPSSYFSPFYKSKHNLQLQNNFYDYFNTKIPNKQIYRFIKTIKDEKFLFFIKYGILRRYEGECEIIYIEIPQIPKKLVVYRRPYFRMKNLDKLNLNNKDLPHIPLFESEDKLKYLSLELNHISKIDQLISLNNLLYLNLYGNNIKEIENLNGVKKLRVLLLGRNNINKIKNLNYLIDLEIIDLHSNKIKYVEGLQNLKRLRILNLSNNLLCSFYDLIYNKNLEELNLRKNLISTIPSISNNTFESLKKINIGKNLINKLQFLEEFTKLKSLKEIILEYNPILNNPDAMIYINKLPIKGKIPVLLYKSIDNNKVVDNIQSNEIIDKIGNLLFHKNRIKKLNSAFNINNRKNFLNSHDKSKKVYSLISNINTRNISPGETKSNIKILFNDKINLKINNNSLKFNTLTVRKNDNDQTINSTRTHRVDNFNDNNHIKINIKIMTINKQWVQEYNYIILGGYNGYNNKKYKETSIDQGYIEIEGDNNNCLNLYGNCLKILMNEKLYENIDILKFNYFCFDLIMNKKYIEYLKLYKNIKNFQFNNNNIFSVYQLTKLEFFEKLENIQIINNEICSSLSLVKNFLGYRIVGLKVYNNEIIDDDEKELSKNIFQTFDNIIHQKEKEEKLKNLKNNLDENENNNKNNDEEINNLLNNDDKLIMWNYVKKNLDSALYIVFNELEEMENSL